MKMSLEKMFSESKERSRVEAIYWAGVLIWAGLVFAISSMGFLPEVGDADAWTYVIFGAGLYGTLLNVYYVSSPDTYNPRTWDWAWSGFWLVVGLSGFFTIDMFWPLALIFVGVVALVTAIRKS
jgi:hypothetical protein